MLQILDKLDVKKFGLFNVFTILPAHEITMHPKHFEIAIKGMRFNKPQYLEAARRILVNNEERQGVIKELKLNDSTLTRNINRVLLHLKEKLDAHQLEQVNLIIPKKAVPIEREREAETIKLYLGYAEIEDEE